MTKDFDLMQRVRRRGGSSLARRISLHLALWLILTLTFLGAMLARAAQVEPKPKQAPSQPKIEVIPDTRPVPKLAGRVNDTANVLKAEDRARIEKARSHNTSMRRFITSRC